MRLPVGTCRDHRSLAAALVTIAVTTLGRHHRRRIGQLTMAQGNAQCVRPPCMRVVPRVWWYAANIRAGLGLSRRMRLGGPLVTESLSRSSRRIPMRAPRPTARRACDSGAAILPWSPLYAWGVSVCELAAGHCVMHNKVSTGGVAPHAAVSARETSAIALLLQRTCARLALPNARRYILSTDFNLAASLIQLGGHDSHSGRSRMGDCTFG